MGEGGSRKLVNGKLTGTSFATNDCNAKLKTEVGLLQNTTRAFECSRDVLIGLTRSVNR